MPLNLWIYSRFVTDDPNFSADTIPYLNLIRVLVFIAIPVAIGMLVASKFPKITARVMKYAKPIVFCLFMVFIAIG